MLHDQSNKLTWQPVEAVQEHHEFYRQIEPLRPSIEFRGIRGALELVLGSRERIVPLEGFVD